ncbi:MULTISPECIES: hypothetical protein [unclassified Rhodanobacter]|uniref:hypothetical protein n=1 Tax=unclassified Rhodanobacter TaxID=2621553 RepID=UPI0007AA4D39|nr:hypothetical protein [Rhodanobacter sp. FW510-R10]KZC32566.1 hypothetical protein RhoFW510R10_11660 [Rhodanobacter sp. FW510-R10]
MSYERKPRQDELWSDGAVTRKMAEAMILVIFGDTPDIKRGLAILIDVVRSDLRIARRVMAIMEATPKIMSQCPELYEECRVQVAPVLTTPRKH